MKRTPGRVAVCATGAAGAIWAPTAGAQITDKTYAGPTGPPSNTWSDPDHWEPGQFLPGSTNNVIHNIGGQLRYDVTNAGNQTIYSMEVEGGDDAELTVESALDLNTLRYMERDLFTDPYLLRQAAAGDQLRAGRLRGQSSVRS